MKHVLLVCGLLTLASAIHTQEIVSDQSDSSRMEELRAEEESLFSGDSADGDDPAGSDVDAFGLGDLMRMVVVLGLVVVAIYGLFYLLKKRSAASESTDDLISVLTTKALPGNRSLHLVEVGRQMFLVGASERSVELVSEIHDQESLDEIRLRAASRPVAERRSFADILSGVLSGGKENTLGDSLAFMSKQKERLKKL